MCVVGSAALRTAGHPRGVLCPSGVRPGLLRAVVKTPIRSATSLFANNKGGMHGLQAESEIFRRGQCYDEDEEAYEEFKRRERRERANKKKPPGRPTQPTLFSTPATPSTVQSLLEAEHTERKELRANLEEREHRLNAAVELALTGEMGAGVSAPISADELKKVMRDNERTLASEQTEFVQSFR